MKVSVIIPVYKVEATIERCLRSVASQVFSGNLECVVVDDATPDASMEVARRFIRADRSGIEWKCFSHDRNRGLSAARNTGMHAASGEYILFLDSDDEFAPGAIAKLSSLAENYPGVDVVQGNLLILPDSADRRFDIRKYKYPEYTADRDWIGRKLLREIPVMAWNKLFRMEWLKSNDFLFKEGILHEDEHWRYQIFDKVGSMAFCEDTTYLYHMNPDSITHAASKDRSAESILEVYNEFFDKINDPSHWLHVVRVLCSYTSSACLLNAPERFKVGFKDLVERVRLKKKLPLKVRMVYDYLVNPSSSRLLYLKIFHRSTYRLLRDSLDRFRSPFGS